MRPVFSNNAVGLLAVAVTPADTVFQLQPGQGAAFPVPAAGQFIPLVVQFGSAYEVVHCTSRADDALSVERAKEGTSAGAWVAGSTVELRVTAGSLNGLVSAVGNAETVASGAVATANAAQAAALAAVATADAAQIAADAAQAAADAAQATADALVDEAKLADGAVTTPKLADGSVTAAKLAAGAVLNGVPTGTVVSFAGASAPSGWLMCDGAAVSRTAYAALFSVIGTVYGAGDGSTTFNLPDLRGEFVRGLDSGRGVDPGRVLGSAQGDEVQSHGHALRSGSGNIAFMNMNTPVMGATGSGGNNGWTTGQIAATGGSETRPRNVALLYIIKD